MNQQTYTDSNKIIIYIQDEFDVKYIHSGMIDWLHKHKHKHKYSYKHPAKTPSMADHELQQEFITEDHKLKAH